MFEPLEGGCLCGRVRYRVTAAPLDSAYCHCRMCQKSSGAPLQASAEFPIAAFEVTEGRLKAYRSSPWALRRFCPDCGSQISFELAESPTYISVNLATLDRPEVISPADAYLAGQPAPLVRDHRRSAAIRSRWAAGRWLRLSQKVHTEVQRT